MLTAEAERRELCKMMFLLRYCTFTAGKFLNLLSNAFKFTPSGGYHGFGFTEPSFTKRRANILVQVIDTGIGISEEKKSVFSEALNKLDLTRPNARTGLGLAISRNIIKVDGWGNTGQK